MNAKEFMNRAYRLETRINNKTEQIQRLRALAERVTAAYGTEAVSHSRNVDSMADRLARISELEAMLGNMIDELVTVRREITETINRIGDADCQTLLELRYLCMKSWSEISGEMGMCCRNVFRKHDMALALVENILAAKENDAS
jgi:hypothetical protein